MSLYFLGTNNDLKNSHMTFIVSPVLVTSNNLLNMKRSGLDVVHEKSLEDIRNWLLDWTTSPL